MAAYILAKEVYANPEAKQKNYFADACVRQKKISFKKWTDEATQAAADDATHAVSDSALT